VYLEAAVKSLLGMGGITLKNSHVQARQKITALRNNYADGFSEHVL